MTGTGDREEGRGESRIARQILVGAALAAARVSFLRTAMAAFQVAWIAGGDKPPCENAVSD